MSTQKFNFLWVLEDLKGLFVSLVVNLKGFMSCYKILGERQEDYVTCDKSRPVIEDCVKILIKAISS